VQVSQWKKEALEELPSIFGQGRMRSAKEAEEEQSRLYEQIGRLKMELDWLKKKVSTAG
jgi:putative transposase